MASEEGISAGSVWIEVKPRISASDWTRLGSEARGGAGKLGDDLGDRIGKAISKRIAQSVRDGLTQGGAGIGGQGTRAGDEYGGRFASSLRTRLDAALRNLPAPTIGAATTEAEQKVRDLRNSIDKLRSQTVGVDISDADALAELHRIQEELHRIGGESASVQVKADTVAAAAQLAAFDAEVKRLSGQTANVNVNTNAQSAAKDVNLLVAAGFAIGPAIIPGAVAAAAAIAGIGAAATSVAIGIGVGKLAFSGVGDAVKALDTQQAQAAKTGATLASQQKSLASGADQVRNAEESMASARANAGDAARRSGQQIQDAERAVTVAQQDATQAQRALNEARHKEVQDEQDLAQSLKGNLLDQQQAALDVAAARAKLAKTGAAQDRIDYEQAILRQQNLQIAGKRLADQQAQNAKTGVDGSKQVAAAQQNVVQAQAKVAAAERGVTDARAQAATQARQSAAAITAASQAVTAAERNVGTAAVTAGATGGAAVDALGAAMSNLSPVAQTFARFLFGLKPQLDDLKATAASGILPGAQQSIITLLPYMGDLRTVVGGVSTEIGSLEVRAAQTFTSPFWRQFFIGFIGGQAVPNLELLYQAGINVAEAGARIIEGFSPVQTQVGGGIVDLTQRFLAFSQSLDHNQGFQDFVRFAQAEVPHVLSTIEALAQAGVHIVAGYAPVGSVVVSELQLLAQIINALPVSVITALASAMTAYKTATLIAAPAQALLNSGLLTGIGRMITYGSVTSKAGATTTAFQRATSAASGFLGGPFIVAVTAAVAVIGYLAEKQADAKASADAAKSSLEQFASAYKDGVTPAATEAANATLANNEALRGLVDTATRHGATATDIVAGLNGEAGARQKVVDAINDTIGALYLQEAYETGDAAKADKKKAQDLEALRDAYISSSKSAEESGKLTKALADEQADLGKNVDKVRASFAGADTDAATFDGTLKAIDAISGDAAAKALVLSLTADRVAASHANAADKSKLFGQILADLGSSAATSGPVFDGLASTFDAIASASLNAHDKASLLKQTLDQMYGAAISQTEAAENQVRTQDSLTTQLGKNTAGFDLNSKSAQGNSEKALANRDAIIANRDALEAALTAAREKYTQDIANGTAETDARKNHDLTIKSILDGVPKTQQQTAAVKDLVAKYGEIPPSESTTVSTPGLDKAINDLITAHAVQEGIDKGWTKAQIEAEASALHDQILGREYFAGGKGQSRGGQFAAGGAVSGPGTATSDSIPAMLSNDEHVITAAEVQAAGGHQNIYALRSAILDGTLKGVLPGFATGGAVGGSFPVTIPTNSGAAATLARLWAQWQASQDNGNATGDLGVGRTIYQVAQALKADHKVTLSAFETALVESGMRNLNYGDRDSLGVFQQRPSQGWGTPAQVMDVGHAAHSYLVRAIANEPRYANATAGRLAQSVQRSAFPDRYDKRQGDAEAVIDAIAGGGTAGIGVSAAGSEQIKAFIRSTDRLPYVFGAAGPSAFDCSGLASAVVGKMSGRGGGNGQRYFVTQDFANGAPAGFKPGAGGTLTVGVNPATHMAGNYGGLGFEARGTKAGILIGAAARKPSTFQKQFHLAKGGEVSLDLLKKLGVDIGGDTSGMTVNGRKLFDRGGYLAPGLTIADNRTGGLERVLDRGETAAYDRLTNGGGQSPVNVHISPKHGAMRDLMDFIDVRVEHGHGRVAAAVGSGVRD